MLSLFTKTVYMWPSFRVALSNCVYDVIVIIRGGDEYGHDFDLHEVFYVRAVACMFHIFCILIIYDIIYINCISEPYNGDNLWALATERHLPPSMRPVIRKNCGMPSHWMTAGNHLKAKTQQPTHFPTNLNLYSCIIMMLIPPAHQSPIDRRVRFHQYCNSL